MKAEIQGDVSFVMEQEEISPTEPCLLSQEIFEQELLTCLKAQKNSQVYFNTRVTNIEVDLADIKEVEANMQRNNLS